MLNTSLLRKFSSIRLSEQETKVFTALLAASEALGRGTVLRAAGGWVRDKLLGNESCDIDIALDNVPGDEFAQFLYEREVSSGAMSSIGVVKENPAQSKHIRTASFRFHGLALDINNLRSETYAEESRIPDVEFAKHPSEDALRRDFTINALYYNLNTKEVEDFTGTGMSDLDSGLIKTPLPASKTFVDDPLRVLRAIRFAARFGFRLDDEITTAWSHSDVQAGLMNKVSRERVGVEISKMMREPSAAKAIKMLLESGLVHLVMSPPEDRDAPSLAGVSRKDYDEWKKSFKSGSDDYDWKRVISRLENNEMNDYYFNYAILFLELANGGNSNSQLVIRLAMKLPTAESKVISTIIDNCRDVSQAVIDFCEGTDSPVQAAVRMGRLIRPTLKEHYPAVVRVALIRDDRVDAQLIPEFVNKVNGLIVQFGLDTCFSWKPVIDGAEIQTEFQLKPGKVIQELLTTQLDMMYAGERDRATIKAALLKQLATRLD